MSSTPLSFRIPAGAEDEMREKKGSKNIPFACGLLGGRTSGVWTWGTARRTLDSGRGLQLRTQYATRCSLEPIEPGAVCAPDGQLGRVEAAAPEVHGALCAAGAAQDAPAA